MELQPRLNGKLVRTRPLLAEDFENLFLVASDPLIWKQHPDSFRYQREVFKRYFNSGVASKGCLVIEDSLTGEMIGSSRFYNLSEDRKQIMIGFTFLSRKYWGGAYNRELKNLMISHAFKLVDAVLFEVGSENYRSRRALEKIGAKLTNQNEKITPDGRKLVAIMYSIKKLKFKGLL
jgi:RimJ/RimL family protein N-acetyltransferase